MKAIKSIAILAAAVALSSTHATARSPRLQTHTDQPMYCSTSSNDNMTFYVTAPFTSSHSFDEVRDAFTAYMKRTYHTSGGGGDQCDFVASRAPLIANKSGNKIVTVSWRY